jgi:hypothetical protein
VWTDATHGWVLPAAAALMVLENTALLGGLLVTQRAPAGVEVALVLKFPLCVGLLQRRAGAFLALLLWEAFTVVVALLNGALIAAARLGLLASAVTALLLLGRALPLFPSPQLGDR